MMLLLIVLHASANTAGQRNDAELYFPRLKSRMRDAQSATTLDESTATQNFRTKQQDQNLGNQKFRRLSHRRHGSHEHAGFNETSPMPTRAELDHLYQIAIDATAPIVNRVDTSCVLRIERVSPPRFCVAANALGATLQTPVCADAREDINKTRASPIGSLAFPQALLCNVVNSHAKLPSLGDAVAVVGFVTSADYLFLNFLSFVNRAAYCERTRRPFYLMLGTAVSQAELQEKPVSSLLPQNFASWGPQCLLDQPNTLNIFKTIALLALFEVSPRPPAVFYMDADTWFGDGGDGDPPLVTLEMYMALAPEAHLFGNQDGINPRERGTGTVTLMNGGLLFLRNSWWSRGFLSLWWQSRCGLKDQSPLWQILLLNIGAATGGRFTFDRRALSGYYTFRQHSMLRIRQQLAVIAESAGTHWHADVDFDKSGQALAPFSITQKILLLPSAAVDDLKGQRLPGLRSDVDAKASTFVCHTKASRKVDRMQRCNFDYACLKVKGTSRCRLTTLSGDDWGI